MYIFKFTCTFYIFSKWRSNEANSTLHKAQWLDLSPDSCRLILLGVGHQTEVNSKQTFSEAGGEAEARTEVFS